MTSENRSDRRSEGPAWSPTFLLYWSGVLLSEIGLRGTLAVNLYHVYLLTGSTALVGVVGVVQGVTLILLAPLGGVIADRFDRRRLLQLTQAISLFASLTLGVLSLGGIVRPVHIFCAVLLNTAASAFDGPARTALIPSIVPRARLASAFALVTPTREAAVLIGPALGGVLIAVSGPGLMYLVDAASYLALVVILTTLRIPRQVPQSGDLAVWARMQEGARYVLRRPVLIHFLVLDLASTILAGWRVVLPAIVIGVLQAGPVVYGILAAAPAAGALIGAAAVLRSGPRFLNGAAVLAATAVYGGACIALANAPRVALAILAAVILGASDALASVVRDAVVQMETPDTMRGRVTALYLVVVRGGPALGGASVGLMASLLGPAAALSIGGLLPVVVAAGYAIRVPVVRSYVLPKG